ncbi:Uncharacterized protein ESCO_003264 [Escovopsis weberi]|uniref:C2 NT-type domain-containing protein n=1 Tax=Escovopsis weberi TaxID=150374 RepID=A0A0M8N166_ESCWE|nr:Uncharacterized protein ESCO_003264 [Escovopsis weberi]
MVALTNMHLFSVHKGRRPRFELHLKIHDLNNVPLVAGHSYIKWHLTYSMHAEHRGRTGKCSILNHRVEYAFDKVVSGIRMSVDRNNQLVECPMEFEILQEFDSSEKITLGFVRLNLAEYVEESGALFRDVTSPPPPARRRADSGATNLSLSPTATRATTRVSEEHVREREPEEGIVRRYLIQDSKINSTLKIGILLVQVDGDRNYVAPPLKTAPVFGGIAGFMAPEQIEDDAGPLPNLAKNRDVAEVQDLYRKTLAASWSRQPAELPADECIEDIFSGGNGWKTKAPGRSSSAPNASSTFDATTDDDFDDTDRQHGASRPTGVRRPTFHQHRRVHSSSSSPFRHPHRRSTSGSSDKSVSTVTAIQGGPRAHPPPFRRNPRSYELEDHQDDGSMRSSAASQVSLTSTGGSSSSSSSSGSERERMSGNYSHPHHYHHGMSHVKEIGEFEARDDMVCWTLGGQS